MGRPLVNSEAVLYGQFVDAAYAMFKREPTNLKPEPQPHEIPDPYELVAWIDMTDFFIGDELPRFYGFVAQNKNAAHEFVLAIRGTEGAIEWWDDAKAWPVPFQQRPDAGRVHQGFDKIYRSMQIVRRPRAGEDLRLAAAEPAVTVPFAEQLRQLHERMEGPSAKQLVREGKPRPRRTYVVTGHSLGSALCTLFVMDKQNTEFDVTTLCTFASPRVGDAKFVRRFKQLPITSWRIVNSCDIVPKVPIWLPYFNYHHVKTAYKFSSSGTVKFNAACWHSMKTYLHWLDANIQVEDGCKP
jgi:predicted lipase